MRRLRDRRRAERENGGREALAHASAEADQKRVRRRDERDARDAGDEGAIERGQREARDRARRKKRYRLDAAAARAGVDDVRIDRVRGDDEPPRPIRDATRGQQAVAVDEDSARRVHQAERMSAVAEFESELERIAEQRARDRESRDREASRYRSRRTREAQARRDGDGAAIQRAAEDASIFAEHRETFFGLTKADYSTLILNTARPPHLQRNRPKPLPLGTLIKLSEPLSKRVPRGRGFGLFRWRCGGRAVFRVE